MRNSTVILLILLITSSLTGADRSLLNLRTPTELKKGEALFSVRHRFYGDVMDDPLKNFFGLDAGANVQLGIKYQLFEGFELNATYTRLWKEKSAGCSYRPVLPLLPFEFQINIDYVSFKNPGQTEENRSNVTALIALQSRTFLKRFTIGVNLGYDAYFERSILGAGGSAVIVTDLGVFEQIALIGEVFPVTGYDEASETVRFYMGEDPVLVFGLKADTYGHRFTLLISNSDHLALRRFSLGTADGSFWRMGFNIARIF